MAERFVTMDVSINSAQAGAVEAVLQAFPDKAQQIISAALNRTGQSIRVRVVAMLASDLKMKRSDLIAGRHKSYDGVALYKANANRLFAQVAITGDRIPLYRFGARQTKRGVLYQIGRDGGRKRLPHAFIATMASGHVGVFMRRGPFKGQRPFRSEGGLIARVISRLRGRGVRMTKGRQSIFELFGPSIPQVAQNLPEINDMVRQEAPGLLIKDLASQMERYLKAPAPGSGVAA